MMIAITPAILSSVFIVNPPSAWPPPWDMLPEAGALGASLRELGVHRDMASSDADKIVADAFRSEQLGLFPEAIEAYRRALEAQPDHVLATARLSRLVRDIRTDPPPAMKLVWQIRLERCWEMDWLRSLLSPLNVSEIIDGRHQEFHDGSIIVDNHLTTSKRAY